MVAVVVLAVLTGALWWLWKRKKARNLQALELAEKRATGQSFPNSQNSRHSATNDPRTGNTLLPNSTSSDFPASIRPSMDTMGVNGQPHSGNHFTRTVYEGNESINLARAGHRDDDPFDDSRSIATDQLSFGSTNVIPIAYVPPGGATNQTDLTASQKLNAARKALGAGVEAPHRPARSPDLDLRLRQPFGLPPSSFTHQELVETLEPGRNPRDPKLSRASVITARTGVSAAPSFMTGSTSFEHETPQIITRRDVQTGVVQQAAVVNLNPIAETNGLGRNLTVETGRRGDLMSPSIDSLKSAHSVSSDPFSDARPNRGSGHTFGKLLSSDGHGSEDGAHQGNSEDLRFSMGSLAYGAPSHALGARESVNSNMTAWSVGQVQVGQAQRVNLAPHPFAARPDQRESVMSGRSEASSFLNAIIPPPHAGGTRLSSQQTAAAPHDMIPSTKSHDTDGDGAATISTNKDVKPSRGTMMSTASEGLSGFDFTFDHGSEPPPLPSARLPT